MLQLNQFASWIDCDAQGIAQHILHLLQTEGATARDVVREACALVRSFTGRDMPGVFAALDKVNADVGEIIAAVKTEFGL